ncbi:MAG: amino acid ABC transporter substrate-binding protein [Sedimenticolaceae bacterium]
MISIQSKAFWTTLLGSLWLLFAPLTQAADEIKIGLTVSLSGDLAELGQQQLQGIQMWEEDVNARGALLGRPVKLIYYDDRSDPGTSARLYERLINEDRVDLLLGPYSSDITLAASTVAEENNFPMLTVGAAAEKIWQRGYKNVFGIDVPARAYMDSVLEMLKERAPLRIALVYVHDAVFTNDMAEGVRRQAAAYGLQMVFDQGFSEQTANFASLVQAMRKANPDVVIGAVYYNGALGIMQESRQQGLSADLFALSVGPAAGAFGDALGPAVEGVAGPVPWMRSDRRPFSFDFSHRYRQRFGSDAGYHATFGYAAGQILEAAVRLAGSLDRDQVRAQLGEMRFRSLLGNYQVDETGKQIGHRTGVLQWQDRTRRLVWPPEVAETTLRFPTPR